MIQIFHQIALGIFGIMPGNYSGITHVQDNMYAIVDDYDMVDGFKYVTLDFNTQNGKLIKATMTEPSVMTQRRAAGVKTDRDCEGVCYFDEARTIFVSGETDQRVLEYDLNGKPTGRELNIPVSMQRDKIYYNYGFEALTYNHINHRFWMTTEATLKADGKQTTAENLNIQNLLRFISFDDSLQPSETYVYQMDATETDSKSSKCVIGVPSMLALDDGRIIVMEREGCFTKNEYGSWVNIKLYIINPQESQQVSLDTPMSNVSSELYMHKTLLCQFKTHMRLFQMNLSNYEGMCIGPRLDDGRQTIILISDSQNGLGRWFYHIRDNIRLIAF